MTAAWAWVAPDVVQAIHDRQICEHGGRDGAPDLESLSAALARPEQMAAVQPSDAAALAASYAGALAESRPFPDGNERTAWVVARLFLAINGRELRFQPVEAAVKIAGLANGTANEAGLAAWIRAGLASTGPRSAG
jgi:death-on-curing protein